MRDSKNEDNSNAILNKNKDENILKVLRWMGIISSQSQTFDKYYPVNDILKRFLLESLLIDTTLLSSELALFDGANFNFSYIGADSLLAVIIRITSGAIGIDGISIQMVKLPLHVILPVLLHICNFCLQLGTFPNI